MKKLTKRKGFNFLRSYFDVLNELQNDSDRVNFLMSIINKQFLGESPKDLNFIVNLCYESQRHQIESSVKGWERAANDTLGAAPGTAPPTNPKELEEKGEEKEKEKEKAGGLSNLLFEFQQTNLRSCKTNGAMQEFGRLTSEDMRMAIDFAPTFIKNYPKELQPKKAENYLKDMEWHNVESKTKIIYE